jgi:hypothetical protein
MLTKGFDLGRPLPLSADKQGIGDRAVISLRFTVASVLVATATATGISLLLAGNPVTLLGTTASMADKSAPFWERAALPPSSSPHSTDQSTPTIQSVVIQSTDTAEALAPTAKDAPTHEIAGASELASQTQTENEALFRQFQAWAAEQDARAKLGRDAQKQRRAARPEIQNTQEPRARVRQQSAARVQAQPVQEARAEQDDPVLSFLQSVNPFKAGPP